MMVRDVTKFHKHHLGVRVCLNVCVCRVSYRLLNFVGGGETPKFSVDVERVYST